MKVIIKQSNQVKNVSFGHAVNFLLPRGLAVLATPENLKVLNDKAARAADLAVRQKKEQEDKAEKIKGKRFVIKAKVGEKGQLFGTITKKELAKEMKVMKTDIVLPKPIKKVGKYEVELKFGDKRVKVIVAVQGNK